MLKNFLRVNVKQVHESITNIGRYNLIQVRLASEDKFPKNILENVITAHTQTTNGTVYDKKPFKIRLEAGKGYYWCLCGWSKNQPFCDTTHQDHFLKLQQRPIKFAVEETKDYWLCNCKQTSKRPFCDGTHKGTFVQEGPSIWKQ